MFTKGDVGIMVEEIVDDLIERRGLGSEWEMIDEDIQKDIKDVWVDIIVERLEVNNVGVQDDEQGELFTIHKKYSVGKIISGLCPR